MLQKSCSNNSALLQNQDFVFQLLAGVRNQFTKRCHGPACAVVIGAFIQDTTPRDIRTIRFGLLSTGSLSAAFSGLSAVLAGCVSDGVNQYGLVSPKLFLALALAPGWDASRSRGASGGVIVSLSSAPICSWNERKVFRILRANQIAAIRKAISTRKVPSSCQFICIQELISVMLVLFLRLGNSTLALARNTGNWQKVQETGRC